MTTVLALKRGETTYVWGGDYSPTHDLLPTGVRNRNSGEVYRKRGLNPSSNAIQRSSAKLVAPRRCINSARSFSMVRTEVLRCRATSLFVAPLASLWWRSRNVGVN